MAGLRYEAPNTVDAAIGLLSEVDGAKVLAGGTDLLVQMREEMIDPDLIVDIKRINETRRIEITSDYVKSGAAMPGAEFIENRYFAAMWPGVIAAV